MYSGDRFINSRGEASRMAVRIPGINIDEYYQQLGPIEPLIRDDRVTEVMVNGNDHVYVEMAGKVVLTNIKFVDEDQLLNVIQFIVRTVGRRIDERSPLCDARLADGSRVNAVIRPLALNGPLLTVRKFSRDPFQVEDLIRFGTCNEAGFGFLKAAVLSKANVIVAGGTGTGKTTFLNVLSGFIPVEDRIVTIEDAAELQLHQEHVCRLETRPKDINLIVQLSRLRDGSRKVTAISELVGMEQDVITMQDIFVMEQKGATPDGKVIAEFRPTGLRPKILDRMFTQGIPLPKEITALFPPPPGYKPATR